MTAYAVARTGWGSARRFASSPGWSRRVGIIGVVVIVIGAIAGPSLVHYGPNQFNFADLLQGPSLKHPFGTDQFGRDVLSRVISSAHVDLEIGFFGVTVPLIIGTVAGLLAGYYGGWFDVVIGRLIDVFTAFPFLVLVIAIVAMLGPGLLNLYIAITVVSWVAYARLARAETLRARRRDYVTAARGLGFSDRRIMFRHLLPNVIPPTFVYAMSDFVLDMLAGASLGYFGLGVQPPQAEWGVMIANGRDFILTSPWLVIFPGVALIVVGIFFSLLGDGLAEYIRRGDTPA